MSLRYPLILFIAATLAACDHSYDTGTARCSADVFNQSSSLQLTRIVPALTFTRPLLLLPAPGDDNIIYVLEQAGSVWRIDRTAGTRLEVIDLRDFYNINNPDSCIECGLLGMAFHPNFEDNGFIYLSFTEGSNSTPTSYVARFHSTDGGMTLAGAPERVNILTVAQPFPNHNGGHIAFGPDRFLYVGLGDGGSARDPFENAQNINTPLGKMLRLNDDGTPAAGNGVPGGMPEIYAYGLRNPWRWSFDRLTGDLWLADVGQNAFEEIDIIVNGGNYGWHCREGLEGTPGIGACSPTGGLAIDPVAVYGQDEGISVTGGYVYRGSALRDFQGVYFFGDYGSGRIWGLTPQGNGRYERMNVLASGLYISSFGEDNAGELYVIDYSGGGIYRLEEASRADSGQEDAPPLLSETNCINIKDPARPVAGAIPYDINEPFWSDGADKRRYMVVPEDTRITVDAEGDFIFPVGTVLIKNFRVNGRFIESRFFVHSSANTWNGYSYQWNDTQTEARLLNSADEISLDGQVWHFPSREECLHCHTAAAGFSLGPERAQMNKNYSYTSARAPVNQIDYLRSQDLLEEAPSAQVRSLKLVPSRDAAQDLTARARSYLHSNCSHCHRPGGNSQSTMDLRASTPLADMKVCNAPPLLGTLGIADARLLAPGAHARSIIWSRITRQDNSHMPPWSFNKVIDEHGVRLIGQWIDSLDGCI